MAGRKKARNSGIPPDVSAMSLDHVHRAHAVLSASAAKRWLNCPPSARLNEQFPNVSSEFAEEGTAAHELCEYKVRKYLHDRMERPQSEYYTEEIEQATDIYAEFVIGIIEEMKANGAEPMALVEEKLDYADHYSAIRITLLNRTEGKIDEITMPFTDIWGKHDRLYAWTDREETNWYGYYPTTADYDPQQGRSACSPQCALCR